MKGMRENRGSKYDRALIDNKPSAKRGVPVLFVKLTRLNPKYASMLDELGVEIRQFAKNEFRLTSDGLKVGEGVYKAYSTAKKDFDKYVDRKLDEGWTKLNERKDFTIPTK